MTAILRLLTHVAADARATVSALGIGERVVWFGLVEAVSNAAADRALASLKPTACTLGEVSSLLGGSGAPSGQPAVRVATTGRSVESVQQSLCAAARRAPNLVPSDGIAFLWTGQGAQYPRMAAGLEEFHPLARSIIERAEVVMAPLLGRSPREVLNCDGDDVHETVFAQALLFLVECAVASIWRAAGVSPRILLGHSIGEVAAAYFAGVLELDDALRLVALRGRAMQRMPRTGAMAAVMLDEAAVRERLPKRVEIAAVNGPDSVVISGPSEPVGDLISALELEGVQCQRLVVSHAFHSEAMVGAVAEFEREVAGLTFHRPKIALVSNVDGKQHPMDRSIDGAYFAQHIRNTVRFGDGLREVDARGIRHYLELGPRPTLSAIARRSLGRAGRSFVASLSPDLDEATSLLEAGANLFEQGYPINFSALCGISEVRASA